MKLNNLALSILIIATSFKTCANEISSVHFTAQYSTQVACTAACLVAYNAVPAIVKNKLLNYFTKQSSESFLNGTGTANTDGEDLASTINLLYIMGGGTECDAIKKTALIILSAKALAGFATYNIIKNKLQ